MENKGEVEDFFFTSDQKSEKMFSFSSDYLRSHLSSISDCHHNSLIVLFSLLRNDQMDSIPNIERQKYLLQDGSEVRSIEVGDPEIDYNKHYCFNITFGYHKEDLHLRSEDE